MHVLFVCTANQCRSPIAQTLFLGSRPVGITASSAGLLRGGHPMPREGIDRMAASGFDLSRHVSLQLSSEMLASADLILGMSRRHVRTIVADNPDTRPRCFTLKDFVRRAEAVAPASRLTTLLDALDAQRSTRSLLGRDRADDVTDPMGRPGHVWDRVIAELSEQTLRLSRILERLPVESRA